MHWFRKDWWKYLFAPKTKCTWISWWTVLKCRIKGHPCGVVYYNSYMDEPGMHCKNCYDDLG